ncbi:unnamed protein product [Paramecium sonneborni]|uniref:WD40-repeat-containing domain n=1 Tax=Paramecium sonneborni TaxID=65129 RepID=A0A8S1NT79_9CILI|nr:unnamed protein product [Paramecium sonneborni]
MLSDFIQQDQIRNLNLKESGYVRQNQLKKPKQLLFQIILPIILCFVLFNYYQLLNQPQLINQEINLNEINQDKVVNFNESSELLNQTQKDSEIQINQINQEKEQENDLEKKQYKEQENLKDNEIINNKHLNSNESDKIFNYQLINSIFYVDMCYAFAFNKEASIMITTNSKYINLYEFKDGQIQLIQTLQGHKDDVRTLYFMKNSNQFISGSDDNNIIIWEIKYNQWQIQQQLNGHTSSIVHIIMNNKEDLIISASEDGTIKFWEKQHNQWKLTQTISDFYIVFSLSLNESQNQLISSNDKSIIVMKQQGNDKKWVQIQKIELENKGFRLSFSGDNQFTFQPISGQYMNLYEWNNLTKQYVKIKDILVQSGDNYYDYWLFPQQFIMEKSILINKFGSVVNVIKKNQNGEFINLQSILFQDNLLYGSATDNGDYLVTWDYKSKEIQIRIYVEK